MENFQQIQNVTVEIKVIAIEQVLTVELQK